MLVLAYFIFLSFVHSLHILSEASLMYFLNYLMKGLQTPIIPPLKVVGKKGVSIVLVQMVSTCVNSRIAFVKTAMVILPSLKQTPRTGGWG